MMFDFSTAGGMALINEGLRTTSYLGEGEERLTIRFDVKPGTCSVFVLNERTGDYSRTAWSGDTAAVQEGTTFAVPRWPTGA